MKEKIQHTEIVSLLHNIGITDTGVTSVDSIATTMERYAGELELFNKAYDLVGSDDYNGIIRRHILDSLSGVPVLHDVFLQIAEKQYKNDLSQLQVADVGSGAGFPGIPLAVAFPEVQFTLVERMSKRCTFLENCVTMLKLTNVRVLCSELEKVQPGKFDLVTFRAFRPLEMPIITALLAIAKPSGYLAAYKAKMQKITEEMEPLTGVVTSWKSIPLKSDFLGKGEDSRERNLVLIQNN